MTAPENPPAATGTTPPTSPSQDGIPSGAESLAPDGRRPWTILGRLTQAVREQNWFAVGLELVIVILGVVIGFQVTAWGQAQADLAREQVYFLQLAEDLRETERLMLRADSVSLPSERAGNRFWAAFYMDTTPLRDSLMLWRVQSDYLVTDARPLLGTAEALVATGDLALIRDDSLRAAIVAYVEKTRSEIDGQASLTAGWREALKIVEREIDNGEVVEMMMSTDFMAWVRSVDPTFEFPADPQIRFPLRPDAFLENRDLMQAAWIMRNGKANIRMSRARMREDAVALLQRVEAHIEP